MSTLKVSAISHPSAASTAFTFNADGSVTTSSASNFPFPSGTVMLFQQTNAPTGWTKLTTHNDKALRVVSGAVSSGGLSAFSAVLNGSVDNTTLTTTQIPSHDHIERHAAIGGGTSAPNLVSAQGQTPTSPTNFTGNVTTATTGGGGAHTHTMNVAYVDVIFASKN